MHSWWKLSQELKWKINKFLCRVTCAKRQLERRKCQNIAEDFIHYLFLSWMMNACSTIKNKTLFSKEHVFSFHVSINGPNLSPVNVTNVLRNCLIKSCDDGKKKKDTFRSVWRRYKWPWHVVIATFFTLMRLFCRGEDAESLRLITLQCRRHLSFTRATLWPCLSVCPSVTSQYSIRQLHGSRWFWHTGYCRLVL